MSTEEVDKFIANVPAEFQGALQDLREKIRAAVPDAIEIISYGVPMFKQGKKPNKSIVSFGAAKSYCSFYVMSPAVMEMHAAELKDFKTSKGAVQFTPEKPLPAALVKKLVKARVAEVEGAAVK